MGLEQQQNALAGAEGLVAMAYYAIAIALIRFVRARPGAPLNRVYVALIVAVTLAGLAHTAGLVEHLRQSAGAVLAFRFVEAAAVLVAAGLLFALLPRSLDPPGRAALTRAKNAMERAEALVHFGSWQWDKSLDRVEWSPELHRIYGIAPGEFEGTFQGYLSRVHPLDRQSVATAVREALEQKHGFSLRERIVRPDGQVRVLASAGDVVLDDQGQVTWVYGACHDITSQEESEHLRATAEASRLALEQQFFQSQKLEAVGRLAGGIAHDFNNMLLVIMGSASMLLEGRADDDPIRHDLKAIEDAADRARNLTHQLLAVARRQVFTVAVVDINEVIRGMEEMLRRTLGDHIRFAITLAAEPLVVRADAGQLQQVLLNLAVNARDAMPDGGTLTVGTRASAGPDGELLAVIDVTDTGSGMDQETLAHMFEPFYTTKGLGGTGLGLATVYGIVTQSGGKIDVDSAIGKGSVFSVSLPRLQEAPVPLAPPRPTGALGGTETVLVVDDSEPVLALTGRILDRAGYQVLTAPSAVWALSILDHHPGPIDLLLTDITMPDLSGPQLAWKLTALKPGVRVLYMSGYDRAGSRKADGRDSTGAVDAPLIEKPFKPDALLRAVRAVLDA